MITGRQIYAPGVPSWRCRTFEGVSCIIGSEQLGRHHRDSPGAIMTLTHRAERPG